MGGAKKNEDGVTVWEGILLSEASEGGGTGDDCYGSPA